MTATPTSPFTTAYGLYQDSQLLKVVLPKGKDHHVTIQDFLEDMELNLASHRSYKIKQIQIHAAHTIHKIIITHETLAVPLPDHFTAPLMDL